MPIQPAAAAAGGARPNAMLARIDHAVLASIPSSITLTLPGMPRPVRVVRVDNVQPTAASGKGPKTAADDVWVGEIRAPNITMSVVTLLTQQYEAYGTVR